MEQKHKFLSCLLLARRSVTIADVCAYRAQADNKLQQQVADSNRVIGVRWINRKNQNIEVLNCLKDAWDSLTMKVWQVTSDPETQ